MTPGVEFHFPPGSRLRGLVAALPLPALEGRPIEVLMKPDLHAHRGRLVSGDGPGKPVHAGCFLRCREIVLDRALLSDRGEMARIFIHELFHFAWLRLGQPKRAAWKHLLANELDRRVRGELGWSAEARKSGLVTLPGRPWRDYSCESFCDTAGWLYSGVKSHPEFTLAATWRNRRAAWFRETFGGHRIPV
jgi:hypothetical protein